MKKFTTTFFLLMAMVLLLPTELKAADVTLTFLVPQTNKGARLHAWLDDPDGDAKDVAFWEWNNNPTVGTNDGNSNFSETVSYNGTDYYSITKTVGNNNNLNKIAAILRISRDEKTLTPVNVSDFSKVKYVIVTESAITVVNNEGGSADASYYLIGDFNNWNTSNTDYNFTVDAANKKATATIPASAFSSNGADTEVYFAVNAIKNGSKRWYLKPGEKIDVVLGSPYAISSYNNEKNFSLCLKNPSTSATEIYTITLDFSSSNDINDSKLTITKSGSGGGETGTGYYLYYSTGGDWSSASTYCEGSDNELKLADGKYNVTFTIPASTSKFYFCVFNGDKLEWSNAIRPDGTGDVTTTTGTIKNTSGQVWKQTTSSDAVTYKLVLDGFTNGSAWNLTKVTAPTTTYTLTYGSTHVSGTATDNGVTFKIPYDAYNNGLSFTISDSEGKTYNPSSNVTLANGEPSNCADNGAGSWLCNEQANTNGYTVTLKDGTVKAVWSTTEIIPGSGDNYYLVGNFFTEDRDNINYDRKIFRFEPDGLGNYTLDIPATLTVDCQVVRVINGTITEVYGPNGTVNVNTSNPTDNNLITNTLGTTTKNSSNLWKFNDRGLNSDGLYTITLSESATKWSITHNGKKRMAYYLSTMEGATAQPSYTEEKFSLNLENGKKPYDNRYFGYIYLDKGAGCYVISNLKQQQDSGNTELSKTAPKLYLQGNENGVIGGGDGGAKVFPNGTSSITSKPFTIGNEEKALSVMLEYNPTQGDNNGKYTYDFGDGTSLSGRVQRANSTDETGSSLPEITSMQILGPGVNGSWNVNEAIPMTYNPTERCWQATVYTNNEESVDNLFRFIVNNSLMYNFGDDETKARVPYLTATDGVSALPSDPNKVIYHKESSETGRTGDDIIFNRPAGEWTVRFYITQKLVGEGGKYEYDFRYTIDGREYNDEVTIPSTKVGEKYVLLRTYSNSIDCKPVDDNVHIFVAHKFAKDGTDTKYGAITGKVHLYEINYIPANTGVVLYAGEGQEALTVKLVQASDINSTNYTESLTNKDYLWKWKENHASESFNNDLVAVLTSTKVGPSVIENDEIVARNFGLGKFSSTKDYNKYTDTDRIGFFRLMEGTMGGHKAYLQYDKGQYGIDGNSQILDKETDVNTVTFSKVVLIFEGFDDNETTGINEIISATDKAKDVYYYNLQGIRVTNPSKGIYINNGKKVIIK